MEEELDILGEYLDKNDGKLVPQNKLDFLETLEHLIQAYKDLKEIEESHRKENGELRERVKELEEENKKIKIEKISYLKELQDRENKIMEKDLEIIGAEEYTKASMGEIIEHYYTANEKCIPVSLVKEKIEEINKEDENLMYKNNIIKILQELLEKRK